MKRRVLLLAATLAPALLAPAQELTFRHFAGTDGGRGWNDGPVATARLDKPGGVAVDTAGNVYFTDNASHTLRRLSASGVVSTLAGFAGFAGNLDGAGASARFNGPAGVAVDGTGIVYVADGANCTIRRVTPSGVVTTLAGNPGECGWRDGTGNRALFSWPYGLAVESGGSLLVADSANSRIRRVTPDGTVTTLRDAGGAEASFPGVRAVAIDATGDVYATGGSTILRLSRDGVLEVWAGSPGCQGSVDGNGTAACFDDAVDLKFDALGRLWVVERMKATIRRVSPSRDVTTVAGLAGVSGSTDGTGAAARFAMPAGLAPAPDGSFLIADSENAALRRVSASGVVTTVAGKARQSVSTDGESAIARFREPAGAVFDASGNLYVADTRDATIRKVSPDGTVSTIAGSPGQLGTQDGTGAAARFLGPRGLALDREGNILVADYWGCTIRKVTPGGVVTTLAGFGGRSGTSDGVGSSALFKGPEGIAVDQNGNAWVTDLTAHTIRLVSPDGVVRTLAGSPGSQGHSDGSGPSARFSWPTGVAMTDDGNAFVVDSQNHSIRRVSATGEVTTVAGRWFLPGPDDGTGAYAHFSIPSSICSDGAGGFFVVDSGGRTVRRLTSGGAVSTLAGVPAWPTTPASSRCDAGVPAEGTGRGARFCALGSIAVAPNGSVLVADSPAAALLLGTPSLDDAATIDAIQGPVGVVRHLASVPATSGAWRWEAVRAEGASGAEVTSPFASATDFTPDVAGLWVFRLTAGSAQASRISDVSFTAGDVLPTATVSGYSKVCQGSAGRIRVDLTGSSPWKLTWSDGLVQEGITESPVERILSPTWATNYSLTSVSNGYGVGDVRGSATIEVVGPSVTVSGSTSICAGSSASIKAAVSGYEAVTLTWSDGFEQTVPPGTHTRAVSPTATTTYTVTSVRGGVCPATATGSATVTVYTPPTATVAGSASVCAGQPAEIRAELTGTPPWTVTWSDGFVDQGVGVSPAGRVVTPSSTTTYTVASVSNPACSAAGTGSATVTVLSGPAPSAAIDVPSPVAPGTTGIVASVPDAGPGATYAWTITNGVLTSGQGSRSIVFAAGQAGPLVLRVTVSVPGGCTAKGSMSVWVGAGPASRLDFTRLAGPDGGRGWFDGPGENARFLSPVGVAVDAAGNVYVVDSGGVVRKVTPGGDVSTLAGGSVSSMTAADGTGALAQFYSPQGIACTPAGVVFVADTGNHVIRRIDPSGDVTTIAGTAGIYGYADGVGADARFYSPAALALDRDGNLLVADTSTHTIRKVTPTGVVTTVAGLAGSSGSADATGSAARFHSPAGIALGPDGNLYVADTGNSTIRRVTPAGSVTTIAGLARSQGSTDGPPGDARFRNPSGIAVGEAGDVFVADSGNYTIRVINVAGNVTTLAGAPLEFGSDDGAGAAARFVRPRGIALDPSGALIVADRDNDTIRRVSASGDVQTIAGRPASRGIADGPAATARFGAPYDVAIAPDGSAWVADSWNHCIRRIALSGLVETIAGSCGAIGSADGPGSSAGFYGPGGIAVSASGAVYVSDTGNATIRRIGSDGVVTTIAGLAGYDGSRDGTGRAARFYSPWGIAVDADENVYVADHDNHTVRKITPSGVVTTLAGRAGVIGSTDGAGSAALFRRPTGLAVDRFGNVYVSDSENGTIRKVTPEGLVSTLAGVAQSMGDSDGVGSAARFSAPGGLRVDGSGKLWVTDGSYKIRTVTPDGVVTTLAGGRHLGNAGGTARDAMLSGAQGMGLRWTGELLVTDRISHGLWEGAPALPDEARIDNEQGPVGVTRSLDAQPRTATSWKWELVRTESSSSAVLSAVDVPNPTFTPDVPGYYRFRLTATAGARKSVTIVSLYADLQAATAVVTGSQVACQREWFTARVLLTGIPPWTVTWSDGEIWTDTWSSTRVRQFFTNTSMELSVVAVSDARGPGVPSGVAEIVFPPKTATPVLQAPAIVGAGSPGRRASVAAHPGSTYSWSVSGGSITAGQGTNEIVFTTSSWSGTASISVSETKSGECPSDAATSTVQVVPAGGATLFYPLTPCRLLDTRETAGPTGGAPLGSNSIGTFDAAGLCGIPTGARAISANVTVTQGTGSGTVVVYPAGVAKPLATTTPVAPGKTRATSAHVKLPTSGPGTITVANDSTGTVHVVVDVNGYYQ